MKTFSVIAKIVAALAAVAGIVYIVATYGDKIVAWAKKVLKRDKNECACEDCECADCECNVDGECICECECEECDCCEEVTAEEVVEAADKDFEA